MLKRIKEDVINILIPRVMKQLPKKIQALFNDKIKYHINPTGKVVIGGPHGDTVRSLREKLMSPPPHSDAKLSLNVQFEINASLLKSLYMPPPTMYPSPSA